MVVDTPLLEIFQIRSLDRTPLDYPQISNAAALHLPKAVAASKQTIHNNVTAQILGAESIWREKKNSQITTLLINFFFPH